MGGVGVLAFDEHLSLFRLEPNRSKHSKTNETARPSSATAPSHAIIYGEEKGTDKMDHSEDVRLEHDIHLLLVPVFRAAAFQRHHHIIHPVSAGSGSQRRRIRGSATGVSNRTAHESRLLRDRARNTRGTKARTGIKGCTHTSPTWSRP